MSLQTEKQGKRGSTGNRAFTKGRRRLGVRKGTSKKRERGGKSSQSTGRRRRCKFRVRKRGESATHGIKKPKRRKETSTLSDTERKGFLF